ncbi:hypothetical protein Y032_0235g3165 [Ancylostoma ceylanicum]|uniref:Uncharacterized protein n=1 Tax=Ancylostoma ceylanicum TaxID=53326 RepID=A0A016SFR0_9BILA|nr:hypothetical protein Y032_0235g3165 [Ancylostoma ceylanicum]
MFVEQVHSCFGVLDSETLLICRKGAGRTSVFKFCIGVQGSQRHELQVLLHILADSDVLRKEVETGIHRLIMNLDEGLCLGDLMK